MDNIKRVKIFLFNGIILTITSFLIKLIDTSFGVFIANKIGAESVGIYELIQSIYFFFITLSLSGINLATTKVVSEELAKKNEYGVKKATKKAILFSFLYGIFASLILVIFADLIVNVFLHSKISTKPIYIMAISLPFISMSAAINGYFAAVSRIIKSSSGVILEQFVKIYLTVIFLNFLIPSNLENSCISLILSASIGEVLSFCYLFLLYLVDKKRYILHFKDNINYSKKILGISIPLALAAYIRSGLSTLKQILIPNMLERSGLSCEEALSKFGLIGAMVLPIILFPSVIINSFCTVLVPEIAHYFAINNYNQIKNITNRIFKIVFIFSFLIFGIFLNFSSDIGILLYNNMDIGIFLKIISPLVIIMYLDFVIDSILKGINEQVEVMKCNILDLFVSIICICFLLPIYGIYGFLLVIYISEILNFIVSFRRLIKSTKIKINFIQLIKVPFLCIIFCSLINILLNAAPFFIKIIWFIVLYIILLYIFSGISKKDFTFKKA